MGVQNNGLFMSGNIERIQSPYNMDYSIDQTNSSSLLPTNINVLISVLLFNENIIIRK